MACLLVSLYLPPVALADEPPSGPCLLPVDAPESIALASYVTTATVVCEGAACELYNTQRYQIQNNDTLASRVVRVASPERPGEHLVIRDVYVRDKAGNALPPTEGDTFQSAVWELALGPNEHREFSLSYVQPLSDTYFLRWRPVLSPVEGWGGAQSAHLTLELPQYAVQSILVHVEPSHYQFDGTKLEWQYGEVESLACHEAVLYAPPTWQRLQALQQSDAQHYALARLYAALEDAAERQGIPYADHYEQMVAHLEAAVKASPQNTEARVDLATLYLERADLAPELSLNYLLLVIQELEKILQYEPQNQQVADRLSRTYYRAAQRAREMDDPGSALTYLKRAGQVPNAPTPYESQELENLRLRLALDLAQKGQVREALTQIQGTVAPETEEALLHYAPPLIGVRTRVDLGPASRFVTYEFQFYPPLASQGQQRLQDVAQRLEALDACRVTLQPNHRANKALLEIQVPFRSPEDLRTCGQAMQGIFSTQDDMISAFVTQPWHVGLQGYDVEVRPWGKRYRYKETVELSRTEELWKQKAQYVRWRLIELRDGAAENEADELRQRLALIALAEQRHAWDQLSSGSYWTYNVRYEDDSQIAASWLISWGQTRTLEIDHCVRCWSFIGWFLGGLALLAFVLIMTMYHRHHQNGNSSSH
ncbi:MAG: hypothetical protein U9R48_02635 [Chloroflexota bacterium]|nr:hypothetical protein [Chloroflexota bacterium]